MDIGANNPKTFYETPHIDRLASQGMRFTSGYAPCPVCSPTRGSIITGKYPPRFGVTDFIGGNRSGKLKPAPNADHLPLEEITIAEALGEAGYTNFFAGKWHLGDGDFSPNAQGFGPGYNSTLTLVVDGPQAQATAETVGTALARVPKLAMFASVSLWCAEICAALRTRLSIVEWPSATKVTG